eukprot:4034672-Amphidinium_carterae.1
MHHVRAVHQLSLAWSLVSHRWRAVEVVVKRRCLAEHVRSSGERSYSDTAYPKQVYELGDIDDCDTLLAETSFVEAQRKLRAVARAAQGPPDVLALVHQRLAASFLAQIAFEPDREEELAEKAADASRVSLTAHGKIAVHDWTHCLAMHCLSTAYTRLGRLVDAVAVLKELGEELERGLSETCVAD